MTDLPTLLKEEIETVKQLRDELKVQISLAKLETRDAWEATEKKWGELEGRLQRLEHEVEGPLESIREAAGLLIEEIGDGYRRIKAAL